MHRPIRTVAPATTPVSVIEAKEHLREDDDVIDVQVAAMIASATAALDGYSGLLGRCMITQTWVQKFDCWSRVLRLPFPDVQSAAIVYRDSADAPIAVSASDYTLLEDARGSYLRMADSFASPAIGPEVAGLAVTLVAGFGAAAADVPAPLRRAILLHVGSLYEQREMHGDGGPPTGTYEALIGPYRRVGV